ncbi:prolactin regulatory element-binding protein isoform X3 [Neomonachus schauinslandi]|uniref:Cell growth regulator with EF hand domain protein 1 n=1 Tax=Neomonachus schauinslandi TaxID=29088 RepID=A0A8M1MLB2_NEOSC|nr:prolactin regulatory element-binding protein isoform X2 [Neomonachus schauinslandi]XP_044774636.1 prolactin regulatory element-binding protein isoform X3 [Neomonachus schauinslandi]
MATFVSGRFGQVPDQPTGLRLFTVQIPHKRLRQPPPCYLTAWDGSTFLPLRTKSCGHEVISCLSVSESGTFLGLGTVTGSVAIYIAFSLQRLYYVKEAHGIVVTDVAFLPERGRGPELLGFHETALFSVAVDSRCQLHLLPSRIPVPARMLLPLAMRMLVLLPLSQAAPKDGTVSLDTEVQQLPLSNPFQPGQEQLRLLQNYLQGLERMEKEPEHMSREQVLLYLFALHDYDQSGQLDGLELLSMLTAALAPGAADFPIANPVILVVDKVLETQDLNGDGLMTPAELINFPGEAPRHTEPKEPPEPQDVGRQSPLAKSPSRQELQGALGPREDGAQVEATRESLEPVQEAGGQAEAEREARGPRAEAAGQEEASDAGKDAEKHHPGETLESKNTQNEFEVHVIQLENDEI